VVARGVPPKAVFPLPGERVADGGGRVRGPCDLNHRLAVFEPSFGDR